MNSKLITIFLGLLILIGLFFNSFKREVSPPCTNADEAAFSYNAYSLAQTGKDEYGTPWPLRLKSFGDYKMPLYSYLSIPFIGVYGLTDTSSRALNIVLSLLFPLAVYLLVTELFDRDDIGILAGLLTAVSLGLNILGRHTHEAYLSAFLSTVTLLLFIKVIKSTDILSVVPFYISLLLLLFSYHPGRIFGLFIFCAYVIMMAFSAEGMASTKKTKIIFISGFIIVFLLFFATDILYKPDRIKNLLFFNNAGFALKINELRGEGGSWIAYNKATVGFMDIVTRHLQYFSPQFLAGNGDTNTRFGYEGMAPMTIVEYLFFFIGIYFMYRNNERFRHLLLAVVIAAPLAGSLSWAETSISRTLFMFIPWLIVSSYGIVYFFYTTSRFRYAAVIVIVGLQLFYMYYSWDFYLNHYPKRAATIRSWQCGYKELAGIVKENYKNTDRFYITKKNGQPYIFMLYYMKVPPEDYQKHAGLTAPDEYGFGQVERFDKFEFNFSLPQGGNYIAVGYPDDFNDAPEYIRNNVSKIKVGTEEIFWVYKSVL